MRVRASVMWRERRAVCGAKATCFCEKLGWLGTEMHPMCIWPSVPLRQRRGARHERNGTFWTISQQQEARDGAKFRSTADPLPAAWKVSLALRGSQPAGGFPADGRDRAGGADEAPGQTVPA